jgi:hypothetical protein
VKLSQRSQEDFELREVHASLGPPVSERRTSFRSRDILDDEVTSDHSSRALCSFVENLQSNLSKVLFHA